VSEDAFGYTVSEPITTRGFRDLTAARMSERTLLALVTQAARTLGYLTYHTHRSQHSEAGFPDLCIVVPWQVPHGGRVIWAELKRERGVPTDAQLNWLQALHDAGEDTYVWRPSDWLNGTIEYVLRGDEDA